MKIASIDIGTNTLLMVIGEQVSPQSDIVPLYDEHSIARLGEGVDKTGQISEEAFERAATIATTYRLLCSREEVRHIEAVATSAVRDAANGEDICKRLSAILGTTVQTISGDEEARFSFIGTSESEKKCTVVDIGGGSTEYVTGENKVILQRMSLQIGAVRLHERYLKSLPPSEEAVANAREEIRRHLAHLPQGKTKGEDTFTDRGLQTGEIVGVGGTFTTLAAIDLNLPVFDSARVHNHILSAQAVSRITTYLLSNSLEELLKNPAIHPKRADILPAGTLILEETLRFFAADSCKASTKGLRYGVLYDAFQRLHS
ncbi:MAG: Ppx/GppA family phosphatase [Candidatus Kapabacteria bacterium]|jgi:exopolyphosphatase/guanosine-5'-triphosphate,3'-diphosphate pyrophosphatase|nr:Ppx/GppA family phosphatase [Candidatus Kapabacteria bacterium]